MGGGRERILGKVKGTKYWGISGGGLKVLGRQVGGWRAGRRGYRILERVGGWFK